MKKLYGQFRPDIERLEDREVPALLAPITSAGGGINLAVADFNQDSRSDVAVIRADDTIAVRLSNGDGTFTRSAILRGARGDLYHLIISDMNGDGLLDVRGYSAGRLDYITGGGWWDTYTGTLYTTIWLGKGDGTFGKATKTQSTGSLPGGWPSYAWFTPRDARADFNGDGLEDYSHLNWDSAALVELHLRNPDGTLQPSQSFDAGPNPAAIAVGDFNGDGQTDIVVLNNISANDPTLSVLFNDGNW